MSIESFTIKRLANDVKSLINNSLESDNIYYKHDEENILIGYALIIGNSDTPYSYGAYLFRFEYPENFPFSPPKVIYLTNDGYMRFNPNLYTNGKVCLSVLNTWKGEGWSSCQSIRSILLILSTILNNNPLLNEPGVNEKNPNVEKYNLAVSYKNIEFSILEQIKFIIDSNNESKKKCNYLETLELFKSILINNFKVNKQNISDIISGLEKNIIKDLIYISTYCLNIKVNIKKLKSEYKNILKVLNF